MWKYAGCSVGREEKKQGHKMDYFCVQISEKNKDLDLHWSRGRVQRKEEINFFY